MIFIYGDNHGMRSRMAEMLDRYNIRDATVLQIGDLGFAHDLDALATMLRERNIVMHALRGNHDNPAWFDGSRVWDNLVLHADYDIVEVEGVRFLLVGGAISVDRCHREEGETYWPDEAPVWRPELAALAMLQNPHVICTHSAPFEAPPFGNKGTDWARWDGRVVNDCHNERLVLSQLFSLAAQTPSVQRWYYGHFHESMTIEAGDMRFLCVGIDEIVRVYLYEDAESSAVEEPRV